MNGKKIRLRRLFTDGKAVIIPMDHPMYFGPIDGLVNPGELITDAADTPVNGLLLTLATLNRMAAGASGVCIGRNIWQRENRKELIRTVCAIVHGVR